MLIVEDDDDLRDGLQRYLRRAGFEGDGLADAVGLLQAIDSSGAEVVVLDVNLPGGVHGFTAAARVQERTSAAVIMLTGRAMHGDRLRGLGASADHYLVKPVDPAELELVIRNLGRWTRAPRRVELEAEPPWRLDALRWRLISPPRPRNRFTAVEHRLLDRLIASSGEPVARGELAADVRPPDGEPSPRGLDLVVFRLQRKAVAECAVRLPLLALRRVGYVCAGAAVRGAAEAAPPSPGNQRRRLAKGSDALPTTNPSKRAAVS